MTTGRGLVLLALLALTACGIDARGRGETVTIGSKAFTESVTLGEIGRQAILATDVPAEHRRELGGTRILWEALRSGEIDAYPDYTGTIVQEILGDPAGVTDTNLADMLGALGVGITAPLGFDNTYVLGVTRETADRLGLRTISDLRDHPELTFGFSNEFMDRTDGWPSLRRAYGLTPNLARGMDHDLAYRALDSGAIDVIDLYSTDAEVDFYDLVTLDDDRGHFPAYRAVFLYRLDLHERAAAAVEALDGLAGTLDEASMIRMNAAVKLGGVSSAEVAAGFLGEHGVTPNQAIRERSRWARIAGHTGDHLVLVLISMALALVTALPLGILAAKRPAPGRVILGVVGAIYTIPALALLVFMIPLLGIGAAPAVVALWLYSLLPIVRNTHQGLTDIPRPLRESADALGLSPGAKLVRVELPLATPSIMAGIKTAVVINIGTATLGALIGAGGLGQPILTGIRLADTGLILEGAVPAALLALAGQGMFDGLERWLVPKGLRL